MRDSGVEQLLVLMTPYVAYLPAEWVGVSGVLAVVTCGIYVARRVANTTSARVRLQAYATWETVIFILNGLVFILIGLELATLRERLTDMASVGTRVWYAVAISGVAIAVRMAYVFAATALSARVPIRFRLPDPPPPPSQVFVIAWTAMRGVVSLAAALALPISTASGEPFPHRDLILFVTFGVILVTLVVQGFSLPLLIRWLKLDTFRDEHEDEEHTARYLTALAAIERLDALVGTDGGSSSATAGAVQRLRATYDERLAYFSRLINPPEPGAATDLSALPARDTGDAVLRETLAAERRMLFQLRDNGVIGDDVLRRVEMELDLEESKLGG
jgi:CPA1 family monovalent cation:H+ antiporter